MNRSERAAEIVSSIIKLIVQRKDKLSCRTRLHGQTCVVMARAVKRDTGRLVGAAGSMHAAIQTIGREISLDPDFEVMIEEPIEFDDAREGQWKGSEVERLLSEIVAALFTGASEMEWDEEGNAVFVTIGIPPGYDTARIETVLEALKTIFNGVGRTHSRVIKIHLAESARAAS